MEEQTPEQFGAAVEILNRAVRARAFPGAVLGVGHRESLVILPVGRLTYEADAGAVTAETIYDLASLTKVLATTTAAMILTERGQLALDRPVAGYIPEFTAEFAGDDNDGNGQAAVASNGAPVESGRLQAARSAVTVRHLLAHTSGLPGYEKFYLQARKKSHVIEEALGVPLEAAPGERTLYSDVGFILLGEIVERAAKASLDAFCRREIFGPLGMRSTCFNPPMNGTGDWRARIAPTELEETFRKRLIWGEVHDENAWVMGGVAGHAGLFGTAGDLARFCRMMLAEGEIAVVNDSGPGGKRLVKAATVEEFTRAWPAIQSGTQRDIHGLGWAKRSEPSSSGRYFSAASYGHLGYTGTSMWIDPDKYLYVILFTNRVHPSRANEAIKQVRPAVHDAVVESLGL